MDSLLVLHVVLASLYLWVCAPKFRLNAVTFAPIVFLAAYNNFLLVIVLAVQAYLASLSRDRSTKVSHGTLRQDLLECLVVLGVSVGAWLFPFLTFTAVANTNLLVFPILSVALLAITTVYHFRQGLSFLGIKALTSVFLIYFVLACRPIEFQMTAWEIALDVVPMFCLLGLIGFLIKPVRTVLLHPNVLGFLRLCLLVYVPVFGPLLLAGADIVIRSFQTRKRNAASTQTTTYSHDDVHEVRGSRSLANTPDYSTQLPIIEYPDNQSLASNAAKR